MIGKLRDITLNRDGTQNITITVLEDFRPVYDRLAGVDVEVSIKKHNKRRSLSANAYCWVLVDKIAEAMRLDKVEVYRQAIRDIGGVSTIVCVQDKAVDALKQGWTDRGIGWQVETMPSKIDGCTNVILYFGTSVYDSKQMATLIDHLIQDAEAIGIETITPKQKEEMLRQWRA